MTAGPVLTDHSDEQPFAELLLGTYPIDTSPEVLMSDAMSNAARYAARKAAGEDPSPASDDNQPAMSLNAQNKAAFIETAIQQAIRLGEFDNLPGAGKPLEGIGTHHDPDWWIRRKIETENLTGLGPPALQLRVEDRDLDDQLTGISSEKEVREILADFNRRVIDARRQLQGGPPVVTATRDIDAEVRAWRERRSSANANKAAAPEPEAVAPRRRRWFRG